MWFIPCILNSSFVDQYYKQQNILIMIDSPSKDLMQQYGPPSQPLKQAILARISSNKQALFIAKYEDLDEAPESLQINMKELQLLKSIKDHQQKENPGYISYCRWKQMHQQLWGGRVLTIAEKTWKILRLINRGEVHLPTGLVFDILKAITIESSVSEVKKVLESFMLRNKIQGGLSGFRDLKNYPQFDQIISQYMNKGQVFSIVPEPIKQNLKQRFTRLNKQNKEKQHKLQQLRYNSLTQEMRECTFSPAISPYISQTSQFKSNKKQCLTKQLPNQQEPKHNFKAAAIDFKIYDKSIQDVPGANAHIKKHLLCQSERQRLQRYISKPFGSFK